MTATFIGVDTTVTGTEQQTLDERLRAENYIIGIVGESWNVAYGDSKRFNFANPFVGNLVGVNEDTLEAILHAVDQLSITGSDFTSNNLPPAQVPLTPPINGQNLVFTDCGDVGFNMGEGKSFVANCVSATADVLTINPATPGEPGTLELVGDSFKAQIRCHENATEAVLMNLPATQQEGLVYWDNLGRLLMSDLSLSSDSATGEELYSGVNGNTEVVLKRIRSAGGTCVITTDVDGAVNVESINAVGRNRGTFGKAKDTSNAWPTQSDGTVHVGDPLVDNDEFRISVTDGTLPSDTFTLTDGSTPVLVKSGDAVILTNAAAPTATGSWVVVPGSNSDTDSNMMSEDLTNTTSTNKLHDGGANDWGLTNVANYSVNATQTHKLQIGGADAFDILATRQARLAAYAGGTFDATFDKRVGIDASGNLVTADAVQAVVSWIQHIIYLNADFPASTVIKLDGSTANTTLYKNGSLDWTDWGDQTAIANDPYFKCLLDHGEAQLDVVPGAHNVMLRNGIDGVTFTAPLRSGTVIRWLVPVY